MGRNNALEAVAMEKVSGTVAIRSSGGWDESLNRQSLFQL